MFRILLCLYIVLLTVPSSAEEMRNSDVLPASEILLRPDEPAVRLELPEMVELQKLVQAQHWSEANHLAAQLVAKNPQEPRGHFWLGYVQLRQRDDLAAIRSLRRAQTL